MMLPFSSGWMVIMKRARSLFSFRWKMPLFPLLMGVSAIHPVSIVRLSLLTLRSSNSLTLARATFHVCSGVHVVAMLGALYNPAHPALSNMRMESPTIYCVMRVVSFGPSFLEIGCPRKLPAVSGSRVILMIIPGPCKFEDRILNWSEVKP